MLKFGSHETKIDSHINMQRCNFRCQVCLVDSAIRAATCDIRHGKWMDFANCGNGWTLPIVLRSYPNNFALGSTPLPCSLLRVPFQQRAKLTVFLLQL